jgi:hypothetical protein
MPVYSTPLEAGTLLNCKEARAVPQKPVNAEKIRRNSGKYTSYLFPNNCVILFENFLKGTPGEKVGDDSRSSWN